MNTPQNFTGNFQRVQGVLLLIFISNAQLLCVLAKTISHLSSWIQTSNKAGEWAWFPHMKKSHMSIQKMPASAPMTCSLSRSCGVHRVSLSDHLPFHEYLPHGLRRRINLKRMNVTLELLKLQEYKYTGRKFQEPQKLDTLLHPLFFSRISFSYIKIPCS